MCQAPWASSLHTWALKDQAFVLRRERDLFVGGVQDAGAGAGVAKVSLRDNLLGELLGT